MTWSGPDRLPDDDHQWAEDYREDDFYDGPDENGDMWTEDGELIEAPPSEEDLRNE